MPKFKKRTAIYPRDHWEMPPPAARGTPSEVYEAVGQALSMWESIENSFAWMFQVLVEGKSVAAQRVYGTITTSHGRRVALQAASEVYFSIHHTPEEIRLYFNDLIANFKETSRRRENDSITAGLSVLDSPSARSKPE